MIAAGRTIGFVPVGVVLTGLVLSTGCQSTSSTGLLEDVGVAFRGHLELDLRDGEAVPLALGPDNQVDLCLEAPPSVDTSQWVAWLHLEEEAPPQVPEPVALRAGKTVCYFVQLPAVEARHETRVCGAIEDLYDGRRSELPCLGLTLEPDKTPYTLLWNERRQAFADTESTAATVGAFDALATRARDAGYPLLDLRFRLITTYLLRREGTQAALSEAKRRLLAVPEWLSDPNASEFAAMTHYEQARVALEREPNLREAWAHLRLAEHRYSAIASSGIVAVMNQQAHVLTEMGSSERARERLSSAIDRCREVRCDEKFVPAAQSTLAWLISQDPDADDTLLAQAASLLESSLEATGSDPAVERANTLLNLAYVQIRRGEDPRPTLRIARDGLATSQNAGQRATELGDWADLIEARHWNGNGDPERALATCDRVAGSGIPWLAARAASCVAELLRSRGDLAGASHALEQALWAHERAVGHAETRGSLGPGQRADDFYRAARNALEQGYEPRAWQILRQLDGLSMRSRTEQTCRPDPQRSEARRALLSELGRAAEPASPARKEQRAAAREELMMQLQELIEEEPPCGIQPTADAIVDYRAFALEDEILVLRRHREQVTLYRKTPFPRSRLTALAEAIADALADPAVDEAQWRELVRPLTRALVPDPADLGDVTTFALHGALQRVPLGALPTGDGSWLSDATVVTYRPANARSSTRRQHGGAGVFVVNPTGDLAGAARLAPFYREAFPAATVLEGTEATVGKLGRVLGTAGWLHIDAHAEYEPSFPDLTRLMLNDGAMTAFGLGTMSDGLSFANLSACSSGRYPTTADSGRYGLAGALVQRGTGWVIGARTTLSDTTVSDFNRSLYTQIAQGASVAEAYREALNDVKQNHSPARWAGLLLLRGEPDHRHPAGKSAGALVAGSRGPA